MSDTGSSANAIGGISLFISICGMIYTAINHKKIRTQCCGRELSASIDIESTKDDEKQKEEKEEKEEPAAAPRRNSASNPDPPRRNSASSSTAVKKHHIIDY